jgi:serine protease Do
LKQLVIAIIALSLIGGATLSQELAESPAPAPAPSPGEEEAAGGRVTLVLRGGASVTGDLLREKTDALVLDLGFTVLTVPTASILERLADGVAPGLAAAGSGDTFYRESKPGSLEERTLKDLADELGESVALVTTPGGLGSGFAIDDRGHFVTNFHVVQGEQEIALTLLRRENATQDRIKLEKVRIVAVSPFLDLALLKATLPEDVKVTGLPLASSEALVNGLPVFAIGNPLGLERTVSEGIISNARRSFEGQLFLQTTTPLNPGNSGGPLLNLRGEVIGVTNMKAGLFSEGLSFAIPSDTLKFFLRNRDVLAFDKDNPGSGFRYLPPPGKDEPSTGKDMRQ